MAQPEDQTHLNATQASGGSQEGVVRWVLGIGVLLAVIAMSAVWIFGEESAEKDGDDATPTGMEAPQENSTSLDQTGTEALSSGEETMEDGLEVVEN